MKPGIAQADAHFFVAQATHALDSHGAGAALAYAREAVDALEEILSPAEPDPPPTPSKGENAA